MTTVEPRRRKLTVSESAGIRGGIAGVRIPPPIKLAEVGFQHRRLPGEMDWARQKIKVKEALE